MEILDVVTCRNLVEMVRPRSAAARGDDDVGCPPRTGYSLVFHSTCPKSYTGTRNLASKVACGRAIPVEVVVLLPLCRTSCSSSL
eukprot:SAG11_NODE_1178_length_5598_cov_4.168394_6_plen_85_part_00